MLISITDVNPFIRNIGVTSAPNHKGTVRPYDMRLLCLLEGQCRISVNQKEIVMEQSSLLFVTPADTYCVYNGTDFRMAVISFDLTQLHRDITTPLLYDLVDEFDESAISESVSFCDSAALGGLFIPTFPDTAGSISWLITSGIPTSPAAKSEASCRLKEIILYSLKFAPLLPGEEKSKKLAEKVKAYISLHASENLSARSVAAAFHYHESYINRILGKWESTSVTRIITQTRMQKALLLLQSTALSVSDIAEECGFHDAKYFARAFRKHYGRSPSSCRK